MQDEAEKINLRSIRETDQPTPYFAGQTWVKPMWDGSVLIGIPKFNNQERLTNIILEVEDQLFKPVSLLHSFVL